MLDNIDLINILLARGMYLRTIGVVQILHRQNFGDFLTPPSLCVDNLFTEAYLLEYTFGKPLPPSTLST